MTLTIHPWQDAAALAALHACRTQDELDREFTAGLAALLPATDIAVCLCEEQDDSRVRIAIGDQCPVRAGDRLTSAAWSVPGPQRLTIRYGTHVLGELLLSLPLAAAQRGVLAAALAHYGTALVNLTLNQESRQATDNYCASLAALEEGIVLFQEEDPAAVMARLLSLASSMVQATAAVLYVLREVGNSDSGLCLEQVLGMPESLLATFHGVGDCAWPEVLLGQTAHVAERDAKGSMAKLAPECVPAILQNLVVLPLRYHGVEAGVCLLFNATADALNSQDLIGRVQSLGQLGAALLHRLRLEAVFASNQSIKKELQIAETIQKRLLPSKAPTTDEYEFAWSAITAQHIGGDYLDLLNSELGDIYGVVADASGHGINSALLMSSFRSTYRGSAAWVEPNELATSLNTEVVNEVGPTGMFITAVLLRLERATRRMTICSAGHCPTLVYRASAGTVDCLASDGPPLGFIAGASYTAFDTHLAPGDVVMLYTDGISEATNNDLDMFGEERLATLLREHGPKGAEEVLGAARRSLLEFTGRDRYDDDVSIVVIRAR